MKVKDKKMRVLIFGAIFALLTSYQFMHYMNNKEENAYELLELQSPYVSSHQIDVGFDKAKSKWDPKENEENRERYNKIISA